MRRVRRLEEGVCTLGRGRIGPTGWHGRILGRGFPSVGGRWVHWKMSMLRQGTRFFFKFFFFLHLLVIIIIIIIISTFFSSFFSSFFFCFFVFWRIW